MTVDFTRSSPARTGVRLFAETRTGAGGPSYRPAMNSRRLASVLSASLLALPVVALTATDADAGGYKYKNCTALARVFPHGVAKSPAAAAKQVRAGYGRPATTARAKKVYWANYKSMDRDRDGTACER